MGVVDKLRVRFRSMLLFLIREEVSGVSFSLSANFPKSLFLLVLGDRLRSNLSTDFMTDRVAE